MVWDRPKWCSAGCKSFKDVEGAGGIGGGVECHVVMVQERVMWHKHIPKLDELPQHLGCIQVAQEPGLGQVFAVMYLHELKQLKTIEDLEITASHRMADLEFGMAWLNGDFMCQTTSWRF